MNITHPINFAIIGDSAAFGIGDFDKYGNCRGWGYHLAKAFSAPLVYINVSRPGAKTVEVRQVQLEKVLPLRPHITAVIVGGNDVLRNDFDPFRIHQNIREITRILTEANSEVLLLQLHDATRIIPMPALLARVLRRRVNLLNAISESIAKEFNAIFLQTRNIDDLYNKKFWHVDRMHPSSLGHQLLAREYRDLLVKRNWMIEPIGVEPTATLARRDSFLWLLLHGTPWLIKRSVDLLPAMAYLCFLEAMSILRRRPDKDPEVTRFS